MSNAHTRRLKRREQSRRPSMLSYLATVAAEEEAEQRRKVEEEARRLREENLTLKKRRLIHMRALVSALGGDVEAVTYDEDDDSAMYQEADIILRLKKFQYLDRVGDPVGNTYVYARPTFFSVRLGTKFQKLDLPSVRLMGEEVKVVDTHVRGFALSVAKAIQDLKDAQESIIPDEEPTA